MHQRDDLLELRLIALGSTVLLDRRGVEIPDEGEQVVPFFS